MGKNKPNKSMEQPGRPVQQRSHVKKKTNSAPKDVDMQEIPFKLREIMKSKMEMNRPTKKRKKRGARQGPDHAEIQTEIPVPKFKRQKRESVGAYLDRMDRAAKHVMFLSKNQPDREPERELDLEKKAKKTPKDSIAKDDISKDNTETDSTQEGKPEKSKKAFNQRRQEKVLRKKEEKEASRLEKDIFKDDIKFGEVAMEPPSFTVKPRKSKEWSKPGEKQLLLKKLLNKDAKVPALSMARKRLLLEERERVVEAYREMKKRKMQQTGL
ncbi:coiled-coil domain-containing protein 137 [Spea bombifrons]|uniref:coiled-coil domain-containing protein 137 n=1 Tax=Spea bombifrons TaxID=233779 RepID=UPI00234A4063|nr:coiled-coil domain-containing protein 137 [Spea bombifrons]